jgi:tripartite-type tricarboxylate transporter receptor subunit TctC
MTRGEKILVVAATLAANIAVAQQYPNKPIRMIVPFAPGGGVDFTARLVGQKLGAVLNQSVVADNRAGAGGVIGTELAAKAAPDGYTLLLGSAGPLVILPGINTHLPYDPLRDFAPVALASTLPFLLVVHPSLPPKSLAELIALAKARPGQLNYATAGNGSTTHLVIELFKSMAGIDIVHVPYKGAAPAVADVLAGQVQLMAGDLSTLMPQVKAGKLRALAVTASKRSALAPELPTVAETGVDGFEASGWFGVLAPAATPRALVLRLNAAINAALGAADARERLKALGGDAAGGTPAEFGARMRDDLAKWKRLITALGLRDESTR